MPKDIKPKATKTKTKMTVFVFLNNIMFGNNKDKRIYLDHAAATPLIPEVAESIAVYQNTHFGNAGSLHKEGVYAKHTLEQARKTIADNIHAHPDEIVFTSGATHANNIAILGVFAGLAQENISLSSCHAITSCIEHPAVLDVFRALEEKGLSVTYVGVDYRGRVDPKEVKEAITKDTVCISIMYANNEIGTRQSLRDIAKVARDHRKETKSKYPIVHTDAAQGLQFDAVDMRKLDVHLLSASAGKFYGPKGAGFLFLRRGTPVAPIMFGGGQEKALNPGTEDIASIHGMAEALSIVVAEREAETNRMTELQAYFIQGLKGQFPDCVINGADGLPHIVNTSFPGYDNEELTLRLDSAGIAVSTRSACSTQDEHASHVVIALGEGHYPENAIRFSMGRNTTKADIDYTLDALAGIFDTMKRIQ